MNIAKQPKRIAIFGSSGFAREVADICIAAGFEEIAYLDSQPQASSYFGRPLLPENEAAVLGGLGWQFAMGIGDNRRRKKVFGKYSTLPFPNLVHPSATCGMQEWYRLFDRREGNIVAAGVRFTTNIAAGDFGIYNLNCTVGHDCIVEDFVNLAPSANISGNVHLAEGVYIGTNAVVLQGGRLDRKMCIGSFATVGAGAVVTRNVAALTTVVGVPARPLT